MVLPALENTLLAGKYRLEQRIGSGGMGQVWIARNEITERRFAIKLLLPQLAANADIVRRFVQEAKISGRLRHPGILEIYDVGAAPELNGAPFLVMELLHGVSLGAAISAHGALPLRFTLLVARSVARALSAAHDKGVVHRDLKPANVFLHRDESGAMVPKLLDFGISKLVRPEPDTTDVLGLTHSSAFLGSPKFMSPEQMATPKEVDGRGDVHALGVLVWWCLVGRSPFTATALPELMAQILSEHRPRLLDALPDAPPGVSEFTTRAFARNRDDRYATAAEAATALDAELAKLGPGPGLDSREWMDELLAEVEAARPSVPPPPPAVAISPVERAGSTTMSPLQAAASPASSGSSGGARAQTQPHGSGPSVPVMALVGLVVAIAITGATLVYVRRPHAQASAEPASPSAATTAAPSSVEPPAQAAASVSASAAPPPSSPALPDASPTTPPRASQARALPPAPAARPTRPASSARPASNDPFRGVTGTGF